MSGDTKKDIWKQKELIDFLQQGLELQIEGAGLEELSEAWMKLADLYNRDGDLSNAREAMNWAEDYGAQLEAQSKAKTSRSSRPGTSASTGAKSRPGTSASTDGRAMRSRPNTGSLNSSEKPQVSPSNAVAEAEDSVSSSSIKKEEAKDSTTDQAIPTRNQSLKSEAEEEAAAIAKKEMAKLILRLKAASERPRDEAHGQVIAESTRMQEKVMSILYTNLDETSQVKKPEISGNSRKFRFWYEDCLHQTERILSSNKVVCKEILAKRIDLEKEEWMHAAQVLIDEQQESNELVALALVDDLVEAYRVEDEDRAAWQLQSNNEVARMCEAILQTWREKAAKQKDDENNILRERHHAEALARQRNLVSTATGAARDRSPTKSPSPVRGNMVAPLADNDSGSDYNLTAGMDFSRLQAAFTEAIPDTAATNSIEVAKLQEQISKWREGAKAQIEAESHAQMKKWKDQIQRQLSTEGKIAAIKAIENERKNAKLKLINAAHERGVLLPHEEIEGVLEAAYDDDEDDDDDGIDGPSVESVMDDLGQGSVASLETAISAITADTANIVGGKAKAASNDHRVKSPVGKVRAKQSASKQQQQHASPLPKTSVKKRLRAEALKAYKRLEAKYTSTASPNTSGDAEEELLKLQLQRQREIDTMVAEQKAHWQAVMREEKLQQMAKELAEAEEKKEREKREKEEQERKAREEEEERAVAIEKEWNRLQDAVGREKDEKERHYREKAEAAEVTLGVKHRQAAKVHTTVHAKKARKKLTKSQQRLEEEQRRQFDRLFPKRYDEISQEAVKKEKAERARIRKEREKFHMVGMTFSSKEKEEAYLQMMRATTSGVNKSVLAPETRHDVGAVESMLEKVNTIHSEQGGSPLNKLGKPAALAITTDIADRLGPNESVSSGLYKEAKPGGPKLDNMLLLSPVKDKRGRYDKHTKALNTTVDVHPRFSKQGRMEPLTVTPKENAEVTQVVTQREGGALAELLETAKREHAETLEKVYTEKQPKLILGQRHDNKGLSGRESRLGSGSHSRSGSRSGSPSRGSRAGSPSRGTRTQSNGGSATSSKPSSPTARSLSSAGGGSRPGTVEKTGRVARGTLDMTRIVGSGSMDWDGPIGGGEDEDEESSALAGGSPLPRAHQGAKVLVTGLKSGDDGSTLGEGVEVVGEESPPWHTSASRGGTATGERPDIEYNYTSPGSSRLHTRPGKFMLENKLPPPKGYTSPNTDLYGKGEFSPQSFKHIADHHDSHDDYETTFDHIDYDYIAHGDSSIQASSEARSAADAYASGSAGHGDGHSGSSMQSHAYDAKYLQNEHYRNVEGWAPGSSLEQGSLFSFDGNGSMESGAEGTVGSIAPLPAFAEREIVYNLKVNTSTYKASERSPARSNSYCCSIAGCNKVFSQSWHLWNHQYQQHGNEIRGSDFALTRRIKVHPHQLIDRKQAPRYDPNGTGDMVAQESENNGTSRSTIKASKDANNAIYGKKNVSASASVVPGGLPPIAASVPLGYYVGKTHPVHGMGGHANPLSLTYAKEDSVPSNPPAARGHFDSRTVDPTMGHAEPSDEVESALSGTGSNTSTRTSGAVKNGGRSKEKKEEKKKKKKSHFDDSVVQQARKWEEGEFLGKLQLHTQKLQAWRRSIQVQLRREARALPTGKWNKRTTEKYIPAASKHESA